MLKKFLLYRSIGYTTRPFTFLVATLVSIATFFIITSVMGNSLGQLSTLILVCCTTQLAFLISLFVGSLMPATRGFAHTQHVRSIHGRFVAEYMLAQHQKDKE